MADAPVQRREYVRFAFYKVDREWRRLPEEGRQQAIAEVDNLYNRYAEGMMIRPYSTVGTRADADILIWTASHELSSVQELARDFGRPRLGLLSDNTHSFLAMTKRSIYLDNHVHPGQERLTVKPSKARYL